MIRISVVLGLLSLAGCTSMPDGASTWRGYTPEQVKVHLISRSETLPTGGWLVESGAEHADGYIIYKKWLFDRTYTVKSYFQVEQKFDAKVNQLGRFNTRQGVSEFCAMNPQHGGFMEGDSFVITHEYDYCAQLIRQ